MAPLNTAGHHHDGSEILASTLFWALLPIALNTMTQPSGRILGFPSWYNFAIRISPIVCAVNAISTLVELLFRAHTSKSYEIAFLGIAAHRFKDASDADKSEGKFENLRKNSVFRVGLFVLGALPQAIMLYASKGIPWEKACCTAYLASFVLDELVLFFSSNPGKGGLAVYDLPLHSERLLGRMNDVVYVLIWFLGTEAFISITGIVFDFYIFTGTLLTDLNLLQRAYRCFSVVNWIAVLGFLHNDQTVTIYYAGGFSCLYIGFAVAIYFETYCSILPVMFGSWIGLGVLGFLASRIEKKWSKTAGRTLRPLATYCLFNHVVAGLIYLGMHYESNDTHRPHWTSLFG